MLQCALHWKSAERFVMLNPYTTSGVSGTRSRTTEVRHGDRLAIAIERAATSLAVDKSAFLRAASERKAIRVLEAQSRHVLSQEDAEQLAAALDTPPAPTPRALDAAWNYRRRVVHAD